MEEREIQKIQRLIVQFTEDLEVRGYADRTRSAYPGQLGFFLDFLRECDAESLVHLTRRHIHQYQMHVHEFRYRDKPLCLASQSYRLMVLKRFFHYLAHEGRILADPTGGLELPKLPRALPRNVPSMSEVRRILERPDVDTSQGLRDKAIMEVLYSTGIRNAELRNLTVGDVDLGHGELIVRRGKGGKDRVLPVGEVAIRYVEEYLKTARPRILAEAAARASKAGRPPPASTWLFLGRWGCRKQMAGKTLEVLVDKYARLAKVGKHLTPHCFRHACATHMLQRRAGLRHVQELLGHRNLSTTQRYTHVAIVDLKREHQRTHPREQPR